MLEGPLGRAARTEPALEIVDRAPPAGVAVRATPLLFVHGAFAAAWCWQEHFMPHFAGTGWHARALSFRGHGASEGRENLHAAGIADYAADLARAIDGLGAPPVVIAHSMGGFVAMDLLQRDPSRKIAGLALLASVPPAGLAGPALSLALFRPTLAAEIGMIQTGHTDGLALHALAEALFAPGTPPEEIAHYEPMMDNESARATLELQGARRIDPARVRGRQPTLVLGARHDRLVPPPYVRTTARQLGVEAQFLENAGHALMLGRAAAPCAARLTAWLDRIAP